MCKRTNGSTPNPPMESEDAGHHIHVGIDGLRCRGGRIPFHETGQMKKFHQPRFPWNKGISLPQLPIGVRSCEVAIIWPDETHETHIFDPPEKREILLPKETHHF